MRSKEERRALHTTPQKKIRSDGSTKQSGATKITKKGRRLYQETNIDGQKLFHELKTAAESDVETAVSGAITTLNVVSGGGAAAASSAAVTTHIGLTGITANDHHTQIHDIDSADHTGTLSVAKGGTGATSLTDGGVLLGSATSAVTAMAVLTDGQMIVGDGTADPVAESGATLRTSIGVGTGDSPTFTGLTLTSNIIMGDDTSIGIADDAERIEFDGAGDISFEGCNVGIGVTDPDTKIEVLNATTQLKLSHDATYNTTFGTDGSGFLTITASGNKVLIADDDILGSVGFASGFAGNGWIIDDNTGNTADATFDNLSIRGALSVYELLIQQIRATNGNILISSAAKVESTSGLATDDDNGTITFEPAIANTCPFVAGDIIMSQQVNPGAFVAPNAASSGVTGLIKKMVYRVASVSNNVCTVTNISGGSETAFDNTAIPVAGDDFVRIGNYDDSTYASRQSVMYLTSDDTNAPFIDMKADLNSYADWFAEASTKLRLGRLDGLTSGGTNEYGLWAGPSTTQFIKASNSGIKLQSKALQYIDITASTIDFYDDISSAATKVLTVGSSGIVMGQVAAGKSNVQITAGAINLRTNTTNKITLATSGIITMGNFSATDAGVVTVAGIKLTGKVDIVGTDNNVCLGTGNSDAGDDNIVIGTNAGANLADGGDDNVLIGTDAGNDVTTGDNNVLIGTSAGEVVTSAQRNVCIGYHAGKDLTHNSGNSNTDGDNVLIGSFAGMDDGDGSDFGGGQTINELTTGKNNVLIGSKSSVQEAASENRIAIGYGALAVDDNSATIGNMECTDIYLGQGAQYAATGGANIHCKGLRPNFDTDWFHIQNASHGDYPDSSGNPFGYIKTHNLGTKYLIIHMYFSTSDDAGGNTFYLGNTMEAGYSSDTGIWTYLKDNNDIVISTGNDYVFMQDNGADGASLQRYAEGYLRIMLWSTGISTET